MRNFNKPKIMMVTLLTCVTFGAHAAWWDIWQSAGDDGNAQTKGNAAAAANKGKPPQTINKTYVGLVNNTTSILTSAVLKDKAGKVLYTSTAGRTCTVGAVCWLRVPSGSMVNGNAFFFYNNDKLISAYIVANQSVNAPLYNIGASMDSLGLYVMNKIQAVNPKVTYNRIDNDIQTTTLSATPYQELADYYLDLMGSSKDNTAQEAKVIKSLADQFAKNKVIPANAATTRLAKDTPVRAKSTKLATNKNAVRSSPPAGSAPTTDSSSSVKDALCSETLGSAMDWLSSIPMVGDAVATAAKTAQSASCPSADQDVKDFMAEQFAIVNTKLGEISTQLTGLENQLKAFEQNYNHDRLTDQKHAVDLLDNKFTIWLENYQRALLTSRGADGKEYNSLNELIGSFNNLNKAFTKNPDLGALLNKLYDDKVEYQAIIDLGLAANFSTATGVKTCKNADTIAGNVLEIRAACNAVIVAMYTKNIILAKQMAYAYNDVYKVYKIDTRSNKTNIQIMEPSNFTKWENNVEQMSPRVAITQPINATEPVYNLVNNLKAKGFTVSGWYAEADKRYLETNYTLSGTVIKSKYAYQHPTRDGKKITYGAEVDNNVANVMGVPVPERFFTGGGADYRNNNAFPWADWSEIGLGAWDIQTKFIVPASGNVAINAFGFTPEKFYNKDKMISPNFGYIEGNRKIFVPSGKEANTYLFAYDYNDIDKIGKGSFVSFMRYTAQDGYAYVWTMQTKVDEGDSGPYKYHWFGVPQCMTNDCLVINTGAKLESLKFQGGPTIEWSYVTPYSNYTLKAN